MPLSVLPLFPMRMSSSVSSWSRPLPCWIHAVRRVASLLVLACGISSPLLPLTASALPTAGLASSFTGDELSVSIRVDGTSDPGHLVITLQVEGDGVLGDLRGVFFQVGDESLLGGLSVSGPQVSSSQFAVNGVTNLGHGSNLNGGGSPCPCDVGIEFGSPGIGRDDFQTVRFRLSHASQALTADFLRDSEFGVRVTSVGDIYGSRNGSSKLVGVVPEPSSALLILLGLGAFTALRPRPAARI